eukprot:1156230-Pelagomonas_calceolata.AAC.3
MDIGDTQESRPLHHTATEQKGPVGFWRIAGSTGSTAARHPAPGPGCEQFDMQAEIIDLQYAQCNTFHQKPAKWCEELQLLHYKFAKPVITSYVCVTCLNLSARGIAMPLGRNPPPPEVLLRLIADQIKKMNGSA